MTRRALSVWLPLTFAGLAMYTPRLDAHDDYRLIGTITKAAATSLELKNKDGKKFAVNVNKQTVVKRENEKVAASESKPGMAVVVDAVGDSESDLLAVEVRLLPKK